ncbi:MAG: hypothetical protein ABI167_09395, partial [Nitrosospira sp.]
PERSASVAPAVVQAESVYPKGPIRGIVVDVMGVAAKRILGLGKENIPISDAVGPGPRILPGMARKVRQDPDAEYAIAERHFSAIDIISAVADYIAVAMSVAAPVGPGIAVEIAEYIAMRKKWKYPA